MAAAAAANNNGNNFIENNIFWDAVDDDDDDNSDDDDDDDNEPATDSRTVSEIWKIKTNFSRGSATVGIVRSSFVINDVASFISGGDNVQTTLFKAGGFRWRFHLNIFDEAESNIRDCFVCRSNTSATRRIREHASLSLSKKPMSRAIAIGFEAWVVAADGHRVRQSSMAEVGAGELWLLEGKTATLAIDRFVAVRDIDAATSAAAGLVDPDGNLTIGFRMFWIENGTMKIENQLPNPDAIDEEDNEASCTGARESSKLAGDEPMSREDFADVILVSASGRQFTAHKAVLASRSPVFAAMIRSADSSDGTATGEDDKLKLPVLTVDSETVDAVLNYMYNVVSDPIVGRAYLTAIGQGKRKGNIVTGASHSTGLFQMRLDVCQLTSIACFLHSNSVKNASGVLQKVISINTCDL
jgi:hypothetical protein